MREAEREREDEPEINSKVAAINCVRPLQYEFPCDIAAAQLSAAVAVDNSKSYQK